MKMSGRPLSWSPVLDNGSGPIYLALADAIEADIASGRLRAGQPMPPQRILAESLGVDLTTVTRAYGEARRRGLIEAVVGRGTFVRAGSPDSMRNEREPRSLVDMMMNLPPQPDEARLRERIADGLAAVQRRPDLLSLLSYRQSAGSEEDRAAGAEWLQPRLGDLSTDRVLVCGGAQAVMAALLTAFARPGDIVLTEALTYPGFRALAAHCGVQLYPLPTDGEGIVPEALAEACDRIKAKALYCTPTIQNPTTATMSKARRLEVAAIARRHGLPIFEDDIYGRLPQHAPQPLAAFAPELTYCIVSLAKCLMPGLRIAYCVAPNSASAARLAAAVRATSLMAPPLMSSLVTQWIGDGSAEQILHAIRREAAIRQRIARQLLADLEFAAHPEGHHIWLTLSPDWNRAEFVGYVRPRGLAAVVSEAFAVGTTPPNAVRISLGAANDTDHLRQALQLVAATLAQPPGVLSTVI
jgi:DNA-binding transcriptional MocR family regulator